MRLQKYACILLAVIAILTGYTNPAADKVTDGVETGNENIGGDNKILEETYAVEITTYQYKDINVEYPQIHGLEDTEREEKINNLIENHILLEIIETEDTVKLEELNMELECRITMQSPELLSFYYVGQSNIDGFKPFDEVYTMTIDLKKGKKLNLSDFIDIDETLVERIKNSTDVTNRSVEEGMDKQWLLDEIQDEDEELTIEFLTKGWYGFVLEPDAIVVEMGVMYASGVYALVRLPGQVVGDRFIFDYRRSSMTAEEQDNVMEIYKGNLSVPIDYNFIEERYGVYMENICTDPQSVYDNTVILDLIKSELDHEKYMKSKIPETIIKDHDYFVFDFNGDGLDDYLVCFHGILWSGSGGNLICIYVQEDDGEFMERLSVTAEVFADDPHKHEAIAVLNKRIDGYYSLVLPWTENRVWSFDSEKGRYDSYRYADE